MKVSHKVDRFWFTYFLIRLFYLFFAVLVYAKLTPLGDTDRYMSAGFFFSWKIFYQSTWLLDFLGGILGGLLGGSNVVSNLPFTVFSFCIIKWAIEELNFKIPAGNNMLLLILISLPNFCVWTSVCSKEVFGLLFSAILGVLIIRFFNRDYKIKKKDWLALYLCLMFKPQYLPAILECLLLIYLFNEYCKNLRSKALLFIFIIAVNVGGLYLVRDTVNMYADIMFLNFDNPEASSNRNENIWMKENDFYKEAPLGMLVAFWGPTINEMFSKPTHFLAGLESIIMLVLFIRMAKQPLIRLVFDGKYNATIIPAYWILFTGICFMHYPFGIFNSGSAIRYRTNFIFLFIILLMYIHFHYQKKHLIRYSKQ